MSASRESRGEGRDGDRVEFLYAGQAKSEIPRDVTHVRVDPSVKTIGWGAFDNCRRLEEVELCDGLGEIDRCAFKRCKSLKRVRIPTTVKKVGWGAFQYCSKLEDLEICAGVAEISQSAFGGCKSLTRVKIPPSIKKIREGAFWDCDHLEVVDLCEVEEIGGSAFARCNSLKRIRIPPAVKKIGGQAFWECERLEELELCEGVGEIGTSAFRGCKYLKRVRIPSTTRKIGGAAFWGCEQLEELEVCEGVGEISRSAFRECKSLKRLRIPSTIKKIGVLAFDGCEQLEELDVCEGLESIGTPAFAGCKSLRRVAFPSTLKLLGKGIFQGHYKLEKVDLREGPAQISEVAFQNCKSLQHIRIPSTVKTIGKRAFSGCIQLVSVELHDGLEEIGELAFEDCFSLRNVSVPSTVRIMGSDALQGCYDIQKLLGTHNESTYALKGRLDGLPIHQLFYGQSHRPSQEIFEQLQNIFGTVSDQVRAFITAESSPDQRKGNGNRTATWSKSGPKSQERCHKAANISDSTSESAMAIGAPHSPLKMYNTIDCSQDCLGMTPLHILASSTKQSLDLYQFIVATQPQCLVTKDRWGCLPILYAIWGKCSPEIVQFLTDSQESAFPDVDLNWDMMVSTLCRAVAPLDVIQKVLEIKQASFSDQNINWQRTTRELIVHCLVGCDSLDKDFPSRWESMMDAFTDYQAHQDAIRSLLETQHFSLFFANQTSPNSQALCEEFVKPLKGWWRPQSTSLSFSTFQFMARCSLPERLQAIVLRKWQNHIKYLVEKTSSVLPSNLPTHLDSLHSKLIFYECEYPQLKEKTSLIELVLWKSKIGESIAIHHKDAGPRDGPDKIFVHMKMQCRINCGAEIIIPNVLPYLIAD